MVDATQPTNTNDDLEDLTSRVSEVERRLAIHNHADPYSQPIWVGNSSQGTANIVKPPSTGVMGENCSNGDALGFGAASSTSSQLTGATRFQILWSDLTHYGYCQQKFVSTVPGKITSLSVYVYSSSANGYGVNVEIYSDNSGSIGSLLFSATPSTGSTTGDYTLTVSPNITISAGTNYWIKVAQYSSSGTAEMYVYYSNSNVYNNSFYGYNNIPTTVSGGDLKFSVVIAHDPSKLFRSSANTAAELASYVGISNKACKQGETADITTWGFKNDYSSLTVGAPYYLTNTYGTIGTSPGTNSKQIGIGFSPTTLLIGNH